MGQSNQFGYVTFLQARQALALRLANTTNSFWTDAENGLYIQEALSVWNCLTQYWEQDYAFTITPSGGFGSGGFGAGGFGGPLTVVGNWIYTNGGGSPRAQSLTDQSVYQIMLYHLLEAQLSGGAWAGTSQLSLPDLTQGVQRRRDEILQASGCNMAVLTPGLPTNTSQIYMPDNVLDVRRIRYIPTLSGQVPSQLIRGDGLSFQRFSYSYRQQTGTPFRWDVLSTPPLAIAFDAMASQPNSLEILVMQAGNTLNPPAASALQVPNDWAWVVKFGALADVLGKESEATDRHRAGYCEKRYQEGLKLMKAMPWLMQAFINNVPVDTPSVTGKDRYDYEWESNPNAMPAVVVGGVDLIAPCPIPTATTSVTLKLVGNAPQPVANGDFVQVPRDVLDVILDEAQHLAAFKMGGEEFAQTVGLHENFIDMAMDTNRRLRMSGIFPTDLRPPVSREDQAQPRYAVQGG